jgi:hypothetical protein
MRSVTNFRPTDAGKLQAVINYKRDELGEQELIKQLLEACANIPQPILGMVKQYLTTHHPSLKGTTASNTTSNKIPLSTSFKLNLYCSHCPCNSNHACADTCQNFKKFITYSVRSLISLISFTNYKNDLPASSSLKKPGPRYVKLYTGSKPYCRPEVMLY